VLAGAAVIVWEEVEEGGGTISKAKTCETSTNTTELGADDSGVDRWRFLGSLVNEWRARMRVCRCH
jgi:hypothetical protein